MSAFAYVVAFLIFAVVLFFKAGVSIGSLTIVLVSAVLLAIPWYFGSRDRSGGPSGTECALGTAWVWLRRFLGVCAGSLLLFGSGYAILAEADSGNALRDWGVPAFGAFIGLFLIYFGIFGQGANRYAWRDDIGLHKQNKRRYRWWF